MLEIHGKLTILGVFVHAVLLYSIFDIYYSSPLVTGLHPYSIITGKGLANRLVIFSAGIVFFFYIFLLIFCSYTFRYAIRKYHNVVAAFFA